MQNNRHKRYSFYCGVSRQPRVNDPVADLKNRLAESENYRAILRADNDKLRQANKELERQIEEISNKYLRAMMERDSERERRIKAETMLTQGGVQVREMEEKNIALESRQAEYEALQKENSVLKRKLNIRDGKESPFGNAGSPSSNRPFKGNSSEDDRKKRGGAQKGHHGHGRQAINKEHTENIKYEICTELPDTSKCCDLMDLIKVGERERSYVRYVAPRIDHVCVKNAIYKCQSCGKYIYARPGDILKKMSYSNSFLAEAAVSCYVKGHTAGDVQRELNVKDGAFFSMLSTVSNQLEPIFEELRLEVARQQAVHADETTWWIDGKKGYSWVFCNSDIELHLYPGTRSSEVPAQFFGYAEGKGKKARQTTCADKPEESSTNIDKTEVQTDAENSANGKSQKKNVISADAGKARITPVEEYQCYQGKTIVDTDRYKGYFPLNIEHQFCFEHLKRDLNKLALDYPKIEEVSKFVEAFRPLLVKSMNLCANASISNEEYYATAKEYKERIKEIIYAEARNKGLQDYQNIWRNNWDSMFAWVKDRYIKCDNNAAERAIRKTVIARKISLGSQSERGARIREVISSVLLTVKLRGQDPYQWLVQTLNKLALNPKLDILTCMPPPNISRWKTKKGAIPSDAALHA